MGKACVNEAAAVRKIGGNPDALKAGLDTLREQTIALNAQQEALKRQLRDTTRLYVETRKRLYEFSSGVLDILIAAVGKHSPSGENLRRLRSRIRRPREAPATETDA